MGTSTTIDREQTAATADLSLRLKFDPGNADFHNDPVPYYKALLAGPPVQREIGTLTTIVARYDDLVTVIRDDRRFSIENPVVAGTERFNVFWDTPTLAHRDPPVHTRLRRMVAPSFAPRKIEEMEPAVRAMVGRLLDAAGEAEFDTVRVLGDQLPMMVFGHMLNVPEEDFSSIRKLEDVTRAIGALKPGKPIPAEFTQSLDDLRAFFFDYLDRRRAIPGNDLLSAIITAHDEKGSLNRQELLGMVWVLLLGGLSTTGDMISYIIHDLLTHPHQLELVRRDPSLIPGAVEESLRYDPPVHTHIRFTTGDTELAGVKIPAGKPVYLVLGAGNYDPAKFRNPETFDIRRSPNDHLSFGEGIHFCIGAAPARLQGRVVLSEMLRRFPRLRLASDFVPRYTGSVFSRGLRELRVRVD
ncbi:MAG TPA: cytochrome P450 [Candidatus Binataceae bacterium]|nr:cytochrome P450 [Candidatus Binataceae bacterium]